ncbi:TOM1 [Scenedesmus sp. PABB004]|nr:TOM1 [Scenedesmus sp. PABB004]
MRGALLVAAGVGAFPQWWNDLENNPALQLYANYGLAAAYGLIALVALVQLVRIQLRVPEYGWTTQKVFHLLNALVCSLRCGSFAFRVQMEQLHPDAVRLVLFDLPGLLFFTTYTLLVLFWAEIYHQARSMPTASLRPIFIAFNALVYAAQGGLWAYESAAASESAEALSHALSAGFLAAVSLAAAAGFLLYGGRLFLMLQRFPIESRGRKKKLREVGMVTAICAACFSVRALLVALSAVDAADLDLDVLGHPLLNLAYYGLAELLPSAWVLCILRKLPPKRTNQGYQSIPTR